MHVSVDTKGAHLLCSSQEDIGCGLQSLEEVSRDNGIKVSLSIEAHQSKIGVDLHAS